MQRNKPLFIAMISSIRNRKIILYFFALKLLLIYYYTRSSSGVERTRGSLKPWPPLPSFHPWLSGALEPDVPVGSCEGYFGNGFSRRVDVLKPPPGESSRDGWFRCFYSETLRSSICEVGGLRMNPDKISMSRGGELLQSVMGREEDVELPHFNDGAFDIAVADRSLSGKYLVQTEFLDRYMHFNGIKRHTMRRLVASIVLVAPEEFKCTDWVEEPTLLITRFEYANLFHTLTDWYSAYVASRVTGLPERPHVVFVDGHCQTPLEEMWSALFSSIRYAKHFNGSVCFRRAIITPLGYETAMFQGLKEQINCNGVTSNELRTRPSNAKTDRLTEFGELMKAALGLPVDGHRTSRAVSGYNILFIRRENYVAHPRHNGKVESRLSNEEKLIAFLKSWASNHSSCRLNLVNGLFAHMHIKEQIEIIQDASVIVGGHGAGLTHIVSARPNAVVLEIVNPHFQRPHFALIARWRGLEYHALQLNSSYARPSVVIKALDDIVKGLGC